MLRHSHQAQHPPPQQPLSPSGGVQQHFYAVPPPSAPTQVTSSSARVFLPVDAVINSWKIVCPCLVEKDTPLGYFRRHPDTGEEWPFRAPERGFIDGVLVRLGELVSKGQTVLMISQNPKVSPPTTSRSQRPITQPPIGVPPMTADPRHEAYTSTLHPSLTQPPMAARPMAVSPLRDERAVAGHSTMALRMAPPQIMGRPMDQQMVGRQPAAGLPMALRQRHILGQPMERPMDRQPLATAYPCEMRQSMEVPSMKHPPMDARQFGQRKQGQGQVRGGEVVAGGRGKKRKRKKKKKKKNPRSKIQTHTTSSVPSADTITSISSTVPVLSSVKMAAMSDPRKSKRALAPVRKCFQKAVCRRDPNKLVLVLDIDHSLLHASPDAESAKPLMEAPNCDIHRIELRGCEPHFVKLRPHVFGFLDALKPLFDITVYTQGIRSYAEALLPILDAGGDRLCSALPIMCRADEGSTRVTQSAKRQLSCDSLLNTAVTEKSLEKLHAVSDYLAQRNASPSAMQCTKAIEFVDSKKHSGFVRGDQVYQWPLQETVVVDDRVNNWADESLPFVLRIPKFMFWRDEKDDALLTAVSSAVASDSSSVVPVPTPRCHLSYLTDDQWYDPNGANGRSFGSSLKEDSGNEFDDNILLTVCEVLKALHSEAQIMRKAAKKRAIESGETKRKSEAVENGSNGSGVVDCANILRRLKSTVLHGCVLVFSSVFPMDSVPEKQAIWQMAEEFGAKCMATLTDSVTHVVGANSGTSKVNVAKRSGKWAVHTNWLFDSVFHFRRAEEWRYHLLNSSPRTAKPVPYAVDSDNAITAQRIVDKLHSIEAADDALLHPSFEIKMPKRVKKERSSKNAAKEKEKALKGAIATETDAKKKIAKEQRKRERVHAKKEKKRKEGGCAKVKGADNRKRPFSQLTDDSSESAMPSEITEAVDKNASAVAVSSTQRKEAMIGGAVISDELLAMRSAIGEHLTGKFFVPLNTVSMQFDTSEENLIALIQGAFGAEMGGFTVLNAGPGNVLVRYNAANDMVLQRMVATKSETATRRMVDSSSTTVPLSMGATMQKTTMHSTMGGSTLPEYMAVDSSESSSVVVESEFSEVSPGAVVTMEEAMDVFEDEEEKDRDVEMKAIVISAEKVASSCNSADDNNANEVEMEAMTADMEEGELSDGSGADDESSEVQSAVAEVVSADTVSPQITALPTTEASRHSSDSHSTTTTTAMAASTMAGSNSQHVFDRRQGMAPVPMATHQFGPSTGGMLPQMSATTTVPTAAFPQLVIPMQRHFQRPWIAAAPFATVTGPPPSVGSAMQMPLRMPQTRVIPPLPRPSAAALLGVLQTAAIGSVPQCALPFPGVPCFVPGQTPAVLTKQSPANDHVTGAPTVALSAEATTASPPPKKKRKKRKKKKKKTTPKYKDFDKPVSTVPKRTEDNFFDSLLKMHKRQ